MLFFSVLYTELNNTHIYKQVALLNHDKWVDKSADWAKYISVCVLFCFLNEANFTDPNLVSLNALGYPL